jgi:peroxiredoxin Q/BCP
MPTAAKKAPAAKKAIKPPASAKKSAAPAKAAKPAKNVNEIDVGAPLPDFSLPATKLGSVSRASLKGKPFVLYFYPKDDTSGCTAQACAFQEAMPNFGKLGVTVIGVSKDSIASHEKFAKKYNLTFPLISDEKGDLCEKFGVWKEKSMYGRAYMGIERSTFVIDGKGVIRAVWRKVSVPGHADEVKKALAGL